MIQGIDYPLYTIKTRLEPSVSPGIKQKPVGFEKSLNSFTLAFGGYLLAIYIKIVILKKIEIILFYLSDKT